MLRGVSGQKGGCIHRVTTDRSRERLEPVVTGFVAKFVQQFHADEFTVAPFRAKPVEERKSFISLVESWNET